MRLKDEDEQPVRMARFDFENLFAAQMTGINRNNGRLRVSLSFATKSQFRSKTPFSQPLRNAFRSCQMNVTVLRSGTRVPNSPSQLQNTLRNGTFVAKSGLYHFAGRFAAVKWGLLCCEVALVCPNRLRSCENSCRELQSVAEWFGNKMLISQNFSLGCEISQSSVFALFSLCFCSDFFFLSISLQFLPLGIIQKD